MPRIRAFAESPSQFWRLDHIDRLNCMRGYRNRIANAITKITKRPIWCEYPIPHKTLFPLEEIRVSVAWYCESSFPIVSWSSFMLGWLEVSLSRRFQIQRLRAGRSVLFGSDQHSDVPKVALDSMKGIHVRSLHDITLTDRCWPVSLQPIQTFPNLAPATELVHLPSECIRDVSRGHET